MNEKYYKDHYGDKPYKSAHICFDCRKVFKRRPLADITGNTETEKDSKCPECGKPTAYIGSKFRPPKADNLEAWNSLRILGTIDYLNFSGWATVNRSIPETKKSLANQLMEMKAWYLDSIEMHVRGYYRKEKSKITIGLLTEAIKKIDAHLKVLGKK